VSPPQHGPGSPGSLYSLTVVPFSDQDGDGWFNTGDFSLRNITVQLVGPDDSLSTQSLVTPDQTVGGLYQVTFSNLEPGNYVVQVPLDPDLDYPGVPPTAEGAGEPSILVNFDENSPVLVWRDAIPVGANGVCGTGQTVYGGWFTLRTNSGT